MRIAKACNKLAATKTGLKTMKFFIEYLYCKRMQECNKTKSINSVNT
jgi:hypothetical protein